MVKTRLNTKAEILEHLDLQIAGMERDKIIMVNLSGCNMERLEACLSFAISLRDMIKN